MRALLHTYKVYRADLEGGIPAVIDTLVKGLNGSFEQSVLVADASGLGGEEQVGDLRVRRVASAGTVFSLPVAPGYPLQLAKAGRSADLLALHMPFPLADLGLLLPGAQEVGVVVHWHADIVRQRMLKPAYGPLVRHTLRRADAVIVSHQSLVESSPDLTAVARKVHVVPYGLDPAPWTELDEEDQRAVRALAGGEPYFFAMGRLVGYKGFDRLVRAAAAAGVRLIIAGIGPEEARLRALIAACGAEGLIELAGFASARRARQLLHGARALVMPSVTTAEAFGLVQVEAMFCGRAVINTRLPTGVPWVARHEQEGLTVPPDDVPALTAALLRLAEDPELAARLGAAGRQRALTHFTAHAFCAAVARVYDIALARTGRAA